MRPVSNLYSMVYFDAKGDVQDVSFHAPNIAAARKIGKRMFPKSAVDIIAIGPTVGGHQTNDGLIVI
jgi:hypothetical protein